MKLRHYYPCCGKIIWFGCFNEIVERGNQSCPFCRSNLGRHLLIEQLKNRVARGDHRAMHNLAIQYRKGVFVKRDITKMLDLLVQAAELGSICAHAELWRLYQSGNHASK
jgi:TPR repeat protein